MPVKRNLLLLSLFSAGLLSLAWYWNLSILIFFGFVPLLLLEEQLSGERPGARRRLRVFGFSYLTFFLWNVLVTWWVVYASFGGACMAFIFNSLLMAVVFLLYSVIKNRLNKPWAAWFLIPVWIAWEHIHTLWDITWTWLTLGNVFAFNHNWVQWYEFTGTSGGTAWALVCNVFVFLTIRNGTAHRILSAPVMKIAAIIILPVLFSYALRLYGKQENLTTDGQEVVVVQPNIDPYNEKFHVGYQAQFNKVLRMLKNEITTETEYLVLPETFITGIDDDLNEEIIDQYLEIQWFRDSLIQKFPGLKVVTGATTYEYYHDENPPATARLDQYRGLYYDIFNSAVYIDKYKTEVYHKSKLVPGVERMPFPALFRPLEKLAINMGGTMGSLGVQASREVFTDPEKKIGVAPVICYESVYADFVTGYFRNHANLIFIITNDGWWDNTPGYVQHMNYARLRAIENRTEIARSANTGISCFIDRYGNTSDMTGWWEERVIKKNLHPTNKLTFFSKFGDLISYASVCFSILLLLWSLLLQFKKSPVENV